MLKKIALGLGVLLVILVGVIATRPSEFTIQRSLAMSAPPEVVFAEVADFHQWPDWSPWEKLDTAMKKTFSGAEQGPGAVYEWAGNDQVGEGRMTIRRAEPGKEVDILLEFMKPFAATNDTLFTFSPDGKGTQVTWSMTGKNDFMGKAFSLVMDMDSMVGKDFESGLVAMKAAAETEAAKREAEAKAQAAKAEADAKAAAEAKAKADQEATAVATDGAAATAK
jgi:uncharacterized protein YndB with AHSA1/START domain